MMIFNKVHKYHQGLAAVRTKYNHQNLLRGIRQPGPHPGPSLPLSLLPHPSLCQEGSPTKHPPDTPAPPPALLNEDCAAYLNL